MLNNEQRALSKTADVLLRKMKRVPDVLLILGSGLGNFAERIQQPLVFPYGEIPHFPVSTVPGHAGQLVAGELEGKFLAVMQGRFHYYEGYSLEEVTYPVKVFAKMGTEVLVVTNAAGILNTGFKPADLMLLTDHLNLLSANPLRGQNNEELGPRFPDMTEVYSKELRQKALAAAAELNLPLREGVYVAMSGPSYETPAEVRMLRVLGADAVGMSTVPEAIVAHYCGMQCLGISCMTNYAAGMTAGTLNHQEVLDNAQIANKNFCRLLHHVIKLL